MQLKTFAFMSGANKYRLQATSLDDAFQIAIRELNPDENTRQVIRHTLYEVAIGRTFRINPEDTDVGV